MNDLPRADSPDLDECAPQEAFEVNSRQKSRELANLLGFVHTAIIYHLPEVGKEKRIGMLGAPHGQSL